MKAASTVRRHLKQLRAECIEQREDPILSRIAYAMESAVMWANGRTYGWPGLVKDARAMADLLRKDLNR